ncbi:MAG: tetratricopeptide repeat protein [Deltaproteobacteria bacterium]|nr:tetratricopeptide repeat protein [Deltaproteobacteria bacterium]
MWLTIRHRIRWLIPYSVICVLVFAIYFNSLSGDFIWDDTHHIANNVLIKDLRNIPLFFTKDFWENSWAHTTSRLYRPLVTLSFAIDYYFWRLNPAGYHFTNLILYLSVCLILYPLSKAILGNDRAAMAASLIFASHPVHSESVTWIFGRTDLIAGFFSLSSFYLYLLYYNNKTKLLLLITSFAVFVLALLSKEIAATLPIIIILHNLLFNRGERGYKKWLPALGYLIILLSYMFLRQMVLGRLENPPVVSYPDFIYYLPWAVINYLKLLFLPINLSALYTLPHTNKMWVFFGLALVIVLCIVLSLSCIRRDKGLLFLILWVFVTILPVLNRIVMASTTPIAERFLFLPSVGFAILAGCVLKKAANQRNIVVITLLIIIPFSIVAQQRNAVWKDELTLYRDILKTSPNAYFIHNNLGLIHYNQGRLDDAILEYKAALHLKPDYHGAYNNLGVAYSKQNRLYEAVAEYKNALRLKPDYAGAIYNLAAALEQLGRREEAIVLYNEFIKIAPDVYSEMAQIAKQRVNR